jgi:hypothetical protein
VSRIKGAGEMRARLKKLATAYPKRVAAALYIEAQIIMTEAKKRCPVAPDGGTLRASGFVEKPEYTVGRSWSVTMSFGGAADAYALAVHEHLSEHSPPSWIAAEKSGRGIHWNAAGTGPKFLENPINEASPRLAERIGDRIKGFGT